MPNKTFKIGNDIFDIPEKEVSSFLADNKDAQEVHSFKVGKDTLDIPVEEVDAFLKETPNAVSLKKKNFRQLLQRLLQLAQKLLQALTNHQV